MPPSPPPDVWTKTNRVGANARRGRRRSRTVGQYILSSLQCFWFLPEQHKASHCITVPLDPLDSDMARLALPVFLLLCFSLLHLGSSRPSRSRKAVSARQSGAAEEDDVKSQLERLWLEVNSLKEMQALQTVCLRGIKAHRKCYLTIEEPKHYHEANENCIAQGGTLATPRDLMENNELWDYAKRSAPGSKDFWIGVADIVKEGQYVDVNSLPVSFLHWDRSKKQPTGTKRESCVALSVAAQGKWYDEVCRNLKNYICEYVIP